MKNSDYIPQTPREILEAHRRLLKNRADRLDMAKALLEPSWVVGEAPGTEVMQYAQLGDFTLYAATTTEAQHKTAPKGAARISWNLASTTADDVIAGGGAPSMDEAKAYAYMAYQAANGFIRGGDA